MVILDLPGLDAAFEIFCLSQHFWRIFNVCSMLSFWKILGPVLLIFSFPSGCFCGILDDLLGIELHYSFSFLGTLL